MPKAGRSMLKLALESGLLKDDELEAGSVDIHVCNSGYAFRGFLKSFENGDGHVDIYPGLRISQNFFGHKNEMTLYPPRAGLIALKNLIDTMLALSNSDYCESGRLEPSEKSVEKNAMVAEIALSGDRARSWQGPFPDVTECCRCGSPARIAISVSERLNPKDTSDRLLYKAHPNKEHAMWPHDAIAIAIYLCMECLEPTALFNQG